ncbi:hypothetical protein AB0910_05775 [Streptomyces sp. NPDC047002]|uniref:hypothetical protein n=1 Tax=Streptomyces sp. NPDC047002 TaxID=3155475 RepID=UPI00345666C0
MAGGGTDRLPVLGEAQAALRALGAGRAALHQRPAGRGHWFADWSGPLAGSDVYVAVMGRSATARKVRVVLDDWILEDVAVGRVGAVLTAVFAPGAGREAGEGSAAIRVKRAYFVLPVQELRVSAGRARYAAVKKLPAEGSEHAAWELALMAGQSGAGGAAG